MVFGGYHKEVEAVLNGQDRQLFLSDMAEHIHTALEYNYGRLFCLLLPHADESFLTKRRGDWNETDFQLTMKKFPNCLPGVLDRFAGQMEMVLHHAMALKELHKFNEIWMEFRKIPEDTELFRELGRRAVKYHNDKFMLKLFPGRANDSFPEYAVYVWAYHAVLSENEHMFEFLMFYMGTRYLPDLIKAVFPSNKAKFLYPFLRLWKEKNMVFLPEDIMWLCIYQVDSWTVREVLATGCFFNTEVPSIHLCDIYKFKLFLDAGFCLNREERLMRLGPRQPMKQASKKKGNDAESEEPLFNPRGFPTLRLLATVKFRRILFQGRNITQRSSWGGDLDKVVRMLWLRHLPKIQDTPVPIRASRALTAAEIEKPTQGMRGVGFWFTDLVRNCSYTRDEIVHMMQDHTDAIFS